MAFGDLILGDGVFSIVTTSGATAVDVGLTRGGGQFTVEREYRDIESDGAYGPVMGLTRLIRETPKLTIRGLEMLQSNLPYFYPNSTMTTTNSTEWHTVIDSLTTGEFMYAVKWTGAMLNGKSVVISVFNAMNRENIDWGLIDKEEVLPEVTFTGHYGSTTRTTVPFLVEYSTA